MARQPDNPARMKLRATLVVDFDADTYTEAARFEQRMHDLAKELEKDYKGTTVAVKDRRDRESRTTRAQETARPGRGRSSRRAPEAEKRDGAAL